MSLQSNPKEMGELRGEGNEECDATANTCTDHPTEKQYSVINCSMIMTCARDFLKILRHAHKSLDEEGDHSKEGEAAAYKSLMDDLGGERENRLGSTVMEFIIWMIVLTVFIALLIISGIVHKMHTKLAFNLGFNRWIMLFMVLITGLPCIRFATLLILEPLAWISSYGQMMRHSMFFIREMKRSTDVTLWFGLLFIVWVAWYDTEITYDTAGAKYIHVTLDEYRRALVGVTQQVTRMLLALTIAGILWTLKTTFFSYLKGSLHYRYLCPRIRRAILDLYGIQLIDNTGKREWSFLIKNGHTRNGQNLENNVNKRMSFFMAINQLNEHTAPVWILKQLTVMYKKNMMSRRPKVLSALGATNDDEKFMEEARNMYAKVVGENSKRELCSNSRITRDDLMKYQLHEDDLDCFFKLFTDKDGVTTIAKDQFLRWAVIAFKNCLGLESTIRSSNRLFAKLNVLLSSGIIVLSMVIWLLLSNLVSFGQFAILFAPFAWASFIYGESFRNTYGGLKFVFGMHPFDFGDRVIVDSIEMKVIEVKLLTTTFIEFCTGDEVTYPNSELAFKKIVNLDINKNMFDSVEFNVSINTPVHLMLDLQTKIEKSLDEEVTFTSDTIVAKKEIIDENVRMIVCFKYLVAYHLSEIKIRHKSKIIEIIMRRCKELQEATMLEKDFEREKDNYECEIVKFSIGYEKKLEGIEELSKSVINVLQKQDSSFKYYTRVILTGINVEKSMISAEVWMRRASPSNGVDKGKAVREIETEIKKKGGVLIKPDDANYVCIRISD